MNILLRLFIWPKVFMYLGDAIHQHSKKGKNGHSSCMTEWVPAMQPLLNLYQSAWDPLYLNTTRLSHRPEFGGRTTKKSALVGPHRVAAAH